MDGFQLLMVLIIIGSILLYVWFISWQKTSIAKTLNNQATSKQALFSGNFNHCTGLPLAVGILCKLYSFADKLLISSSGTDIELAYDKISDISIMTDKDVQKYINSSSGGAIAGAMMLGPLGALIGGRNKITTDTTYKNYMIVTFLSDGETKTLSFEMNHLSNALEFRKYFYSNYKKENVQIVL